LSHLVFIVSVVIVFPVNAIIFMNMVLSSASNNQHVSARWIGGEVSEITFWQTAYSENIFVDINLSDQFLVSSQPLSICSPETSEDEESSQTFFRERRYTP